MPGRSKSKIVISSSQKAMRVPRKKLQRLIRFVAVQQKVRIEHVDLAVVTARQIASLNRKYRGRGGSTDVLSFDLSEVGAAGICAQIVVCGQIAVSRAKKHGTGPQAELMLYVVHALLHLCGYDDSTPRPAATMRTRQEQLLAAFLNKGLKRTQHQR